MECIAQISCTIIGHMSMLVLVKTLGIVVYLNSQMEGGVDHWGCLYILVEILSVTLLVHSLLICSQRDGRTLSVPDLISASALEPMIAGWFIIGIVESISREANESPV